MVKMGLAKWNIYNYTYNILYNIFIKPTIHNTQMTTDNTQCTGTDVKCNDSQGHISLHPAAESVPPDAAPCQSTAPASLPHLATHPPTSTDMYPLVCYTAMTEKILLLEPN